jgi:SNF2 family DNA or RNA helicase
MTKYGIIAHLIRHDEDDRKCPECRRAAPIDDLISVSAFNARFNLTPEPAPVDEKGKGKAVDSEDEGPLDKLSDIVVPGELDEWISSSKIDRMVEVVRSAIAKREKVIVFSQFTSLHTLIEKPLLTENINYIRVSVGGIIVTVRMGRPVALLSNTRTLILHSTMVK